ncbi:helix-turn-helix transcriptional regulator [Candidatus Dojkabacteria bacterium]|uniref:Helix-turn-helix transcriptional regulator n=1 Tax=Candidatus Dojkabacteria bacterium TaxID=2099670 RepID=A0A955L718_9BACT|nr:helix-turn-helix transcriptional regulator [Candidatus Dojkabacteria bacterium]
MTKSLGERIRDARQDAKLSQLQVAVALGVSDKTISGYESGRISPPINKLEKLADMLKKPVGYFIGSDPRNYTIASRLRAVEIALREIRQELREIKVATSQGQSLDL